MRTLSKAEMKAVSAGQCYDQYGQGSYSCSEYVPPPQQQPTPPPPPPVCSTVWIQDSYSSGNWVPYYICH